MFALPPDLSPGVDKVSGVTCPACHGSLEVRVEGAAHLHFTCRVGHSFSLREVLAAHERFLEDAIWASIRATEELEQLLADVIEFRQRSGVPGDDGTYEERRRRARAQAEALRRLVEQDGPITFTVDPGEEIAKDGA
jgi:two-component system chemotaxis response regulator CheB